MNKKVFAAVFAVALAGFALPAASQQAFPFNNEIQLSGSWIDQKDPDLETTNIAMRYGRFLRPQIVGTLGLRYAHVEVPGPDASAMAALIGAKYYFTPLRAQAMVPFIDGAVGLAHTDSGRDDSTDLTWEIGGGVSWFFTQAWSFDAGLRLFSTDTDIETKGTQLFVAITARF
jgi:opacity protein-like surface antigen